MHQTQVFAAGCAIHEIDREDDAMLLHFQASIPQDSDSEMRLSELEALYTSQYAAHGRGALHCTLSPRPTQYENRKISFLPIGKTLHAGDYWDELRARLHKYDATGELIICMHDQDDSAIYNLKLPKTLPVSSKDAGFWDKF